MNNLSPLLLVCMLATMLCSVAGRAWAPDNNPTLCIETGRHSAPITGISADATGRYIASASYDNTIRVWDCVKGAYIQTLRPPVGQPGNGPGLSVAMAPDGKSIACGGDVGQNGDGTYSIYIFDRKTGSVTQHITGFNTRAWVLAYSPDGQYLAAGLYGFGLRVYSTERGTLVGEDESAHFRVGGAAFLQEHAANSDTLFVTTFDGFIRKYLVSPTGLRKTAQGSTPSGEWQPYSIAISADGSRVAVGCFDQTRVFVFSAADLSLLYAPSMEGLTGWRVSAVGWSPDGKTLYVGGDLWDEPGDYVIRRFADGGKDTWTDVPMAKAWITSLSVLPGGRIVYSTAEPSFGITGLDCSKKLDIEPLTSQFLGGAPALFVSHDGTSVAFGCGPDGQNPAVFSLVARQLTPGPPPDDFVGTLTDAPGLNIEGWNYQYRPALNGVDLGADPFVMYHALAISPDFKRFALGSEDDINCYDTTGRVVWGVALYRTSLALAVSGDGKLLVSECDDGTIRWFRMSDGAALLTLFPSTDRKRWIAWTQHGYYDCSPGGGDMIGWQVSRGLDHLADYFPASTFRKTFYRPDVVASILGAQDETGKPNSVASATELERKEPPVVTIVSPESGDTFSTDTVTIRYTVRTPSGTPALDVHITVDGRKVEGGEKSIQIVSSDGQQMSSTVSVPRADCALSIVADNSYSSSEPATVQLHWRGTAVVTRPKPKLYILAVGITAYPSPIPALNYPAKDAQDFVDAMSLQKGLLYGDVSCKVLTDRKATRQNILDGLDWIERQATQYDVAMIFFSGHGVNDAKGNYYFAPVDTDIDDIRATGVRYTDIEETVQTLACKTLIFIDTCHAGNVLGTARLKGFDINGAVNELSSAENGAVVFASSTGRQESQEDSSWGNGAFTKALVEGIHGRADSGSGRVTWESLSQYVSDRVKELTRGEQTPTTTTPTTVPDFPIAVDK